MNRILLLPPQLHIAETRGRRCLKYIQALLVLTLLMSTTIVAHAQTVVTGKITDDTGEVLPGAIVTITGTTSGALSDEEGEYSIEVPDGNALLVFSFMGYERQEEIVGGRTVINIRLVPSDLSLSEVVVVGYGTQRKESVTGSVASIRGEAIREVPSSNVTQALQGRLAGVEISQVSSKPGAAMQIRVRGTRSLTASNDPLIVLDGIPFAGNIGDLNPNDIKSIDILKDASATAIYGSRGANGVVLVTTYKGYQGQKAQLSYNSFYGVKDIFANYPMMDGPEFVALRQAAGLFTNGVDEDDNVDINWQDLLFAPGIFSTHNLGVSGGTERGSYTFGVGYVNEEAVIPGQNFERFSLRAGIDQEINDYIKLGFSSNSNYSVNNGNNLGIYGVLASTPIANPYNDDGTLKRTVQMALDEQWVTTRETVEGLGDAWIDQTKAFGSYNNLYAELQAPGIEGLRYRSNIGLNFRMSSGGNYTGEGVFNVNPTNPSTASINNALTTSWVVENLLMYDRTFADKHSLSIVGLFSAQQDQFNSSKRRSPGHSRRRIPVL